MHVPGLVRMMWHNMHAYRIQSEAYADVPIALHSAGCMRIRCLIHACIPAAAWVSTM